MLFVATRCEMSVYDPNRTSTDFTRNPFQYAHPLPYLS
jgi:hypothetical protein